MTGYSLSVQQIESHRVKYSRYKIVLAILDFILIRLAFSAAMQFRGISLVRAGH